MSVMVKKKASTQKKEGKLRKKEEELLKALPPNLPDEEKKRILSLQKELHQFKEKVLGKFEEYVMGVSLLPPKKDAAGEVNVLVLIDDGDSKSLPPDELKGRLQKVMSDIAGEVDKHIKPEVLLISEVWQSCFDGKYDLLEMIAVSVPVFDKGMLAAIKIAEVHKSMVLRKFEKYIVCYVLAGSLVQGRATPKSDIDVFIVIDDTDVKKMTRAELKDKLRAIIIGMGIDAGKLTGIENKLNIQVYILTDFWDNIKEANPIIFTFLRDGVPFYDRGIFMPWKQLLKMGKVKPSPEAIDIFMQSGSQMMERIKLKLRDIGLEDTFWAILTPSQAALMLYGVPPPTPKETPEVLRNVFVKKEKLLEEEYVKILEKQIKVRKDLEHGDLKGLSGKDVDTLVKNAEKYLARIKTLFGQIEELKDKESVLHAYESTVTVIRDILRLEGVERVSDIEIIKVFEKEVIHKGLMPERYLRILKDIVKAKKDYDRGALTKTDIHQIGKHFRELLKFMVEYMQRKRGAEVEKAKIRVKHGNAFGEVILLGDEAFFIHDIDNEDKEITRATLLKDGSFSNMRSSSLEELEQALAKIDIPPKVFLKERTFEQLKDIFGRDVEILVNA
ncbi:nucleotidyltransferase domain-containing protein [Candidatus Woesearchaeota archaeon]|nr:MAG: nucleotidyltransferase domain-containing protein [Candidatus Woesearchaeota archaeon]